MIISLFVLAIFLISGTLASPRAYAFSNGENASVVLGFSSFDLRNGSVTPNASNFLDPGFVAFDSHGNLWVADESDGRVLEFAPPFTSGESASIVLGTSSFNINAGLNSPNSTNIGEPSGLAFDSSGNLWVSDWINNRILEFKAPLSTDENATTVLGQDNFTSGNNPDSVASQSDLSGPEGIAFDSSGDLWVADSMYYRVVEFKAPLTTGESESLVIGQTNFTTGAQDIPGCPHACSATTSPSSLDGPVAVAFDSSGNLWVSDPHGGRILRFPTPLSTGESANLALGVSSTSSAPSFLCIYASAGCIGYADGLTFDSAGNLWAVDYGFGRVLEFTQPFSTSENASLVIGQPNMTAGSSVAGPTNATQSSLYADEALAFDSSGNLWVSDSGNNRVVEFPTQGSGAPPSSSSSSSSIATTSSSSSSSSISVPISSTTLPVITTSSSTPPATSSSSVTPPPATASSSSSSSLSSNYLLTIAVVAAVMLGSLIVVRRRS
jgi:sugar lactone lactonase YvrE